MLGPLAYYTSVVGITTSKTLQPVPQEQGCLFPLPILSPALIFTVLQSLQGAVATWNLSLHLETEKL